MEIQNTQIKKEPQILKLSIISAAATWATDMLLYPIDVIATRLRVNKLEARNFIQEAKYIYKAEGMKSFYRGFTSTFPSSFFPTIIYFYLYENLNKICKENISNKKLLYTLPFFTAGMSEIASIFTYLPIDIVRTRLQVNMAEYNYVGVYQGLQQIIHAEGIFRIFKSSPLYILTSTLFTSFQFVFYELARVYLLMERKGENLKMLTLFESVYVSLAATIGAALLVNPLDIIFTRYQIIDSKKEKLEFRRILKEMIKKEGYISLSKGLGAKIIYASLFSVIWMPTYEYCKANYGINLHC